MTMTEEQKIAMDQLIHAEAALNVALKGAFDTGIHTEIVTWNEGGLLTSAERAVISVKASLPLPTNRRYASAELG
jgi:hypothetical protein